MSEPIARDPGARPEMKWLPLDVLVVDRTYQRECSPAHAQNIMRRFNWIYFQAVTVTAVDGGKYAVIDGQHRVLAARAHPDIQEVPCIVVRAPTVEEQARGFVEMNRTHKAVTQVQTYWAAVAAKDPEYLMLEISLREAGVKVWDYSGYGKRGLPPGTTMAVGTCLRILRRFGNDALVAALRALREAWPNQKNSMSSWAIDAVDQSLRDGLPRKEVVEFLSFHAPPKIEREARWIAKSEGKTTARALADMMRMRQKKRSAA